VHFDLQKASDIPGRNREASRLNEPVAFYVYERMESRMQQHIMRGGSHVPGH
jgi:uncharacterized membrane protein